MHADSSPFSLSGKVVIQCGGTGLLGRALVASLARAGATLVVASRNRAAMEPIAAEHINDGRSISIEEYDINSEDSILGLRDRVLAEHKRIDGVVFNAVTRPMKSMNDSVAQWRESMAVNATGLFATLRAFGDAMAKQESGSIVNISSQMGMIGANPFLYLEGGSFPPPDYFFHKGGMINFTRYLASYYGPKNVRVNVVSPGGIFNKGKPQAPGFLKNYAPMTMLGRMANPEEIGGAVVFLLSDASTYVTGANIPVDGGYTAK